MRDTFREVCAPRDPEPYTRIIEAYKKGGDMETGTQSNQKSAMDEATKQFLIKFLVVFALIVGAYVYFSPFETCLRASQGAYDGRGDIDRVLVVDCAERSKKSSLLW